MEASDSQPLPLILKVALDLEQVKRIRYSDSRQLSFAAFQQRISTVLQLSPHKQHSIIYDDDDGEQCEIACDDTLAEAIAYFTPSSGQVTSISMRVSVNLVSTLTLSDFGGSEMDDGESGVASSYWGSYRAPSASGGFSASGAAESNVQAASRLSGSSPFRSYQGSSELYRPSSISSSHLQQRSEGSSSNGRITSISHEQILASNGRESSSLSFLAPAPPLSQWGSSSLAHLGNTNGFDALPGDDFNEVRRRRNADILQRAAELRARSGRSPPSSQTTSHISGSQADSNHLPPPAASHSYHTQSQWDGMSSLSGSIGPGLFPVQELAAAAASQRNEAARAQVEKMERHIFEMQAILDMEKRKLREEEQWQLDVAAGAHSSPPTSHRGPSVGGSPDPNVSQSFGRQGKRTRMIRIDAPLDDSGDESEPESVQTISNFSVMPGRSTTAQSRLHAASTGGTHDLVPTAIDLAAKGFLPEDETALATMQQPPRPSPGVFVESAESVQSKSEGVQGEEQAGDGTLLIEDGKEKVQHPTCSTCKAHVEGDSLRYIQIRTRSSTVPGPQHAFFELLWREDKWTPIEDELPVKCTHCVREDNWQTGRYKCSSCDDINLCGSCFKRVDDIHPPHVFLRMPVRAASIPSSSSSERRRSSAGNGRSMPPVHTGVECAACGQQPITGTRWHCASCLGGRDFCVRCEADEDIMAAQAEVAGHSLDHLLIKIAAPLDGNVVSKLGNSLIRAQQRLAAQAERAAAAGPQPGTWSESVDNLQNEWDAAASNGNASLSRQHQAMEQAWQTATTVTVRSTGEQKGAQCFNCQKSLHNGPRFICANCPLGQLTPGVLGLNLCEDCEKISQDLHDPSHFFIKIQRPRYGGGGAGAWTALNAHAIARLRARTGDDIEAPLLPILYKDARAIATGETLANVRAHVISTSIARRHDGSNEHQNGQDTDDEDEDVLRHVQVSIDSGSSGPSGPIQRTWPLRQPFATTLALARSGKLGKAYQKTLQSTIRSWVQNTKDEFEMYRLNLVSPRNSNPERWRWFEDIGTKNAAYVPIRDLVHPSILCDSCYECIEGVWYRCCSCKESFDLCSRCEGRVEHDSRHVFAVFKQPVDMALFKSLIDHAAEANGHSVSARPMLPVLLVGQDE
ncbi:unnamed protein product [Tilletia controversa]|nr:unnamed protein product [Tilletia controversa]